jgi:nitrite reductase/ring-hydroxylating ferredoxin subunit
MAEGMHLCTLADLDATGAKGVTLGTPPHFREIVVVRTMDGVRAYANRCPHMYSTLDTFPDRFLDETRAHLVCSTHGARFRVTDGFCVSGPCQGHGLEPVAIKIEESSVTLAGESGIC